MQVALICGPSGAGKDTLVHGALQHFARHNPPLPISFATKLVTRRDASASSPLEAPISDADYDATLPEDWLVRWEKNEHRYGFRRTPQIARAAAAAAARSVLCLIISRGQVEHLRATLGPTRVIYVTAPEEVLQERLSARNRTPSLISQAARLAQAAAQAPPQGALVLCNSGTVEEGVAALAAALSAMLAPPAAAPRAPRRPWWLALSALVGVLGVALSLAPQGVWPAACPASIRSARHWLWRALLGPSAGPLGFALEPPTFRGLHPATGLPLWAPQDLRLHGSCAPAFVPRHNRTLLGVAGHVYDVTDLGLQFYGPGAAYCMFAGRDATRSLALGSLAQEDLDLGGNVTGVDAKTVQDQHEFYAGKYGPAIGALAPVQEEGVVE